MGVIRAGQWRGRRLVVFCARVTILRRRHVRREIRQDLKKALGERSQYFSLTKGTQRKRLPIHALFGLLIVIAAIFLVQSVTTLGSLGESGPEFWYQVLRLTLSAAGVAAAIIFYIRWTDNWFRQHADEEFRLKRLELDIDRASWVVEMALEWQLEKGAAIPKELIDRLTENLFSTESQGTPTHPSEDLASALLEASSGLTVRVPGLGQVTFDRKGIRRFKDAAEKAATEGQS